MKQLGILRDEKGNVLVLTAIFLIFTLSAFALAVDAGHLYYVQRQLQSYADAAAFAGELEESTCGTSSPACGVMTTAATTAITEGGGATPTLFTGCGTAMTGTGLLLEVNNGPCAVSGDPNSGDAHYVEAVVREQVHTFFGGLAGIKNVTLTARAEAGGAGSSGGGVCMLATSPSASPALTMNSGTSILDASGSTCGVQVDSSSSTDAADGNSGVSVDVASFNVVGGIQNKSNVTWTNSPTTGASSVADPYASLTPPSAPATSSTNVGTISGATTLQPGTYTGMNFNGGGYTVNMAPGIYYFTGNFMGGSSVTLTGSNVTIYMAGSSQFNTNGMVMNLTAPTSGSTSGMIIWEATGNTSALNLDSYTNAKFGGAVYLPSAQLTLNGGSSVASYGTVIANTIMLNSTITMNGTPVGGGSGGTITLVE